LASEGALPEGSLSAAKERTEAKGMTADGSRTEELINAIGTSLGEPAIAVVGCGGAGSNIVHGIYWKSNRVETVAINTDEEHLRGVDAHKKVLIGKDVSFGRDAGGFPEVGEHCAEKAREVIREALRGYDIVFVVAGMGGGTGTGVAPIVASVAREANAVTFALPILPFAHEGQLRRRNADEGVAKVREHANFTVVLDNNKLVDLAGDLPMSEALKIVDRSVLRIVEGVCNQTSSYVSSMLEDIMGYSDALEEHAPEPPAEMHEPHLVHADLDPMFNGFGPSMFG
jgi:cell division protein FtsZ